MKRFISTALAVFLVLGNGSGALAQEEAQVHVGYDTTTFKMADTINQVDAIDATLTIPNYIGSVDVTLQTSSGVADTTVQVVYLPNDKWDGTCYYSAMTARIRRYGVWLFTGSMETSRWYDLYNYGFQYSDNGGAAVFSSDSAELHFLDGPGLYTTFITLPYSAENTGYIDYPHALANAEDMLQYTAIGFPFILVLDDDSISHFMEYGTLNEVAGFTWPGLKELLLSVQYQEILENETAGLENFITKRAYTKGMFLDMPFDSVSWYDDYVEKVVKIGLMKGSSDGRFLPEGNVKLSEVIAMAARLHNIYYAGNGEFSQGPVWYNVYVNYALANGIINEGDFDDYSRAATRGEMAYIFGRALPAAALTQINTVDSLPDVDGYTAYNGEIFSLYRAGILTGYEDLSYQPHATITRSETAAILARMADQTLRMDF